MTCNCIDTVNAELAQHNTKITLPIVFSDDQTPRPMIVVDQIETGRGKKRAVGLFASYCPFCGKSCAELSEECTCGEVCGEDPDCSLHGEFTEWGRANAGIDGRRVSVSVDDRKDLG